jgi:hypothetical protein
MLQQHLTPVPSTAKVMYVNGNEIYVPVVVHIISDPHNDDASSDYVSSADVTAAIAQLNNSFADLMNSTQPSHTDVHITFCLAQLLPDGTNSWNLYTATPLGANTNGVVPGITRILGSDPDFVVPGLPRPTLGDRVMPWYKQLDDQRYLNIYLGVVPGPLGIGLMPFSAPPNYVFVDRAQFVPIAGSTSPNWEVFVHEVGHYLNLYHTFEVHDCLLPCDETGDFCCDTDPDATGRACDISNYSPSNGLCAGNTFDPIESDYMQSGSTSSCFDTYTSDQAERMRVSLDLFRPKLASEENLVATGIIGGTGCLNSLLSAAFVTSIGKNSVTTNINLPFGVRALNTPLGASYTYAWQLPGSNLLTASTPSVQNIVYANVGIYTITLTVTDNISNAVATYSRLVYVGQWTGPRAQWYFGDEACLDFTPQGTAAKQQRYYASTLIYGSGIADQQQSSESVASYGYLNNNGLYVPVLHANSHKVQHPSTNVPNRNYGSITSFSMQGGNQQAQATGLSRSNARDGVAIVGPSYAVNGGVGHVYVTTSSNTSCSNNGTNLNFGLSQYEITWSGAGANIVATAGAASYPTNNFAMEEGIAVIPHTDPSKKWILCKPIDNNGLLFAPVPNQASNIANATGSIAAYLVTSTGLDASASYPILSPTSIANNNLCTGGNVTAAFRSFFDISKDGRVVAFCNGQNQIALSYFDRSTGTLAEQYVISTASTVYGIAFSPSGKILYVGYQTEIEQYDLDDILLAQLPPSPSIITLDDGFLNYQLRRGPDDRIYCANDYSRFLDVINFPDALLTGQTANECGFVQQDVQLTDAQLCHKGLPNDRVYTPYTPNNSIASVQTNCLSVKFYTYSFGSTFTWNFGDLSPLLVGTNVPIIGGGTNTGTYQYPTHTYAAPGTYTVTCTVNNTNTYSTTIIVAALVQPILAITGPNTSCVNNTPQAVYSAANYVSYAWSCTNAMPNSGIGNPYQVQFTALPATLLVTAIDANGCAKTATLTVTSSTQVSATAYPAVICGGVQTSSLSVNASCLPPGSTILWTLPNLTTSTTNPLVVAPVVNSVYTLTVSNGGSSTTATVLVSMASSLTPTILSSALCWQGSGTYPNVTLQTGYNSNTYAVQPPAQTINNPLNFIEFNALGTYTITAQAGTCIGATLVTVSPSLTLSIGPVPACNSAGSSVSINCSSNAANTQYLLQPGSISNATGNFSVNPLNSTTYTITATAAGCVETSTVNVYVAAISTSVNPSVLCGNSLFTITCLGANTYTFNPGNITNTTGILTTAILATTTYTITGTDAALCNIVTTVTAYYVPDNMCPCISGHVGDYILVPPSPNSPLFSADLIALLPAGAYNAVTKTIGSCNASTPLRIVFNGMLLLSDDLNFENCEIYIAEDVSGGGNNSRIECNDHNLGILCGTTIQACNKMWQGISDAANVTTKTITIDNSTIKDMLLGVQLHDQFRVLATNSWFYNNNVSLQFDALKVSLYTDNIIHNNVFAKQGTGMLAPLLGNTPAHGIKVLNSRRVRIGHSSNTALGNTFSYLRNGIYNEHTGITVPIWAGGAYAQLQTYYNKFDHIQGGIELWTTVTEYDATVYEIPWGAAIFCKNKTLQNRASVLVKGNTGINGTLTNFDYCGKALVTTGFGVEFDKNNSKHTSAGALMGWCNARRIKITDNNFEDVMLGVSKSGSHSSNIVAGIAGFHVTSNAFTLAQYPVLQYGISGTSKGIDASCALGTYSPAYIMDNTIKIPLPTMATGISLLRSNKHQVIKNTILFTAPATAQSPFYTTTNFKPTLIGVELNNSKANIYKQNWVTGTGSANQNTKFDLCGLYIIRSDGALVENNAHDYVRYGVFVMGPNFTNGYDQITCNRWHSKIANVLCTRLAGEGQFGNIGDVVNLSNGANSYEGDAGISGIGLANFYRFAAGSCALQNIDEVVTTSAALDVGNPQSSRSNLTLNKCCVKVTNPALLPTPICGGLPQLNTASSIIGTWPPITTSTGDQQNTQILAAARALVIANDGNTYVEFNDGARRFDEVELVQWLRQSPQVRAQYPVLDDYYLERHQESTDILGTIDDLMALAVDSLSDTDSASHDSLIQEIYTLNEDLDETEYFVAQEKWINGLLLQALSSNFEFSATQMVQVQQLTQTCPYLGGNAVYKSRDIWAAVEPGKTYNDRVLCNSQGVYRGTDSQRNLAILQQLEAMKLEGTSLPILVYPNPTTDKLKVACNLADNATQYSITITNVAGQVVAFANLDTKQLLNELDISKLSAGIYSVRILVNNIQAHTTRILKN